jgi:hypothetical protein
MEFSKKSGTSMAFGATASSLASSANMWYNRGANSIWVYGDFQTVTVMHNVPDVHDGMSGLMTLSVAVPSDELSRPNIFGVKV